MDYTERVLYFLYDFGNSILESLSSLWDILTIEIFDEPLIFYFLGTGFGLFAGYTILKWVIGIVP